MTLAGCSGKPGATTLKVHFNCTFHSLDPIYLLSEGTQVARHFCDVVPGQSGGPNLMQIGGVWKIVALNTSQGSMGLRIGPENRNLIPIDTGLINLSTGLFSFYGELNKIVNQFKGVP